MKAITVYPLWGWAIVHGHKPVENRTWATRHRGPLAIHASMQSAISRRADADARAALEAMGIEAPRDEEIAKGAVVGAVTVDDCLPFRGASLSPADPRLSHPLAEGPVCWLFSAPIVFRRPIPALGRQGLFDILDAVMLCKRHNSA